jgi:hypothetical protein
MKIWWVTRHFLFWSIFSGLSWLVQHLVSWCMWCLCISHMGRTYHFMPFFFIASNSISSTYDHIKEIKRHKTTCLLTPIVVGTWKRHLFLKFEWCYSANRNTSWGIIGKSNTVGRDVCIMSVTYGASKKVLLNDWSGIYQELVYQQFGCFTLSLHGSKWWI